MEALSNEDFDVEGLWSDVEKELDAPNPRPGFLFWRMGLMLSLFVVFVASWWILSGDENADSVLTEKGEISYQSEKISQDDDAKQIINNEKQSEKKEEAVNTNQKIQNENSTLAAAISKSDQNDVRHSNSVADDQLKQKKAASQNQSVSENVEMVSGIPATSDLTQKKVEKSNASTTPHQPQSSIAEAGSNNEMSLVSEQSDQLISNEKSDEFIQKSSNLPVMEEILINVDESVQNELPTKSESDSGELASVKESSLESSAVELKTDSNDKAAQDFLNETVTNSENSDEIAQSESILEEDFLMKAEEGTQTEGQAEALASTPNIESTNSNELQKEPKEDELDSSPNISLNETDSNIRLEEPSNEIDPVNITDEVLEKSDVADFEETIGDADKTQNNFLEKEQMKGGSIVEEEGASLIVPELETAPVSGKEIVEEEDRSENSNAPNEGEENVKKIKKLKKKKMKPVRIPKERDIDFALELHTGISNSKLQYNADASSEILVGKQGSEKSNWGASAGLLATVRLNKNWMLAAGLEIHKVRTLFDYQNITEVQSVLNNQLLTVWLDSATGDTISTEYGDASLLTRTTRTIVHHNVFWQTKVPLLVGYQVNKQKLDFGLLAGPVLQFTLGQSGRLIDGAGEIAFFDSNDNPVMPSINWGLRVSPFVSYKFGSRWALTARPQWNWSASTDFPNSNLAVAVRQFDLQLGLSLKF